MKGSIQILQKLISNSIGHKSQESTIQYLQKRLCTSISESSLNSKAKFYNFNNSHCLTTEYPRKAWIESLNPIRDGDNVGMVTLHPDIFAALPRLDIIHENKVWQMKYREINYNHAPIVRECPGGGRKPWPQKGTGRARQGSIRNPQWAKGGTAHGPRKYTTHFYMLPIAMRLQGLISTLSCKFAQDDLKIVDSLDIPTEDPAYIQEICDNKYWGHTVLFVDKPDYMSKNITLATDGINHFNLMPSYGLNVLSMLKHDTVVLTVDAVRHIQEQLLYHQNRPDKGSFNVEFNQNTISHVKPKGFYKTNDKNIS